jgi:hypothetical protein
LAVFFAILGENPAYLWAVVAELVLIVLILGITQSGRHLHDLWLDYRLLAEQLRQIQFLAPLGRVTPSFRVPAYASESDIQASWAGWLYRALVREAGMTCARHEARFLQSFRQSLRTKVVEQAHYHASNSRSLSVLHDRLHKLGQGLFFVTLVACAGHFFASWALPAGGSHELWGRALTVLTVVLPACGAALAGIQSHGEFQRIARRSEAMAKRLRQIGSELKDTGGPPTAAELGRIAEAVAEMMTGELLDWRLIVREKPLTLPA